MTGTHFGETSSLALFVIAVFASGASAEMRTKVLTVDRQYPGDRCTAGYLSVDGNQLAYTLEPPWVANINSISSIPNGSYSAVIRSDGKLGFRLELEDVPGRSSIEIHVGNTTEHTHGCILVGAKVDAANLCALQDSKVGMAALEGALFGATARDDKGTALVVQIRGGPKRR